ncbi:hypothetical protein AYI70_g10848, partial [Smittium culicis]
MKKRKQDYTSTPFKSPLRQHPKLDGTIQTPKTLPTKLPSMNNPINVNSPLHSAYRPKIKVNLINSELQKSLDNLPKPQKSTPSKVTEFSLMKNTSTTHENISIDNNSSKSSLLNKKQKITQEIKRLKDEISLLQTAITVSKKENGAEVIDLTEKWKNVFIDSSEQLYKLIEPALISSSNISVHKLNYHLFSCSESRKESEMTAYSQNQNLNIYKKHELIADRNDYNEKNEYSSTYSNENVPQELQKQDSTCSTGSNEDMY